MLYRTKSFELNRYYIEHPVVHGFLNIASIPISILSAVPDKLPPDVVVADDDRYIVGTADIASFVNKNAKRQPTPVERQQAQSARKTGLLDYCGYCNGDPFDLSILSTSVDLAGQIPRAP